MSIDLECPSCRGRLRVADSSAGLKAKCPQCQTVFPVPGGEPRRAEPVLDDSPLTAAPPANRGGPKWSMKTPHGQTFGPVDKRELDTWVAEGRVTGDCQLLREGQPQWSWARDVYPALAAGAVGEFPTFTAANPYQSPASAVGAGHYQAPHRGYQTPHRGGMILTFGILSLVLCNLFGPFAWIMGSSDMAAMRAGRMDRSGEGLTQGGMICGIIGTVLLGLMAVFFLLAICAGLA